MTKWKHDPKVAYLESDDYSFDQIIARLKELYNEPHPNSFEIEKCISFLMDKINQKLGKARVGV